MDDDPRLLAFYAGTGTDGAGRTLAEILGSSFETLEHEHDYIQWLFPLPEPSPINADAPTLTGAAIGALQSDPALKATRRALDRMLAFYGLALVHRGDALEVVPNATFTERRNVWLRRNNHNHLRLTRILRCCYLLGLRAEAHAFGYFLDQLAQAHPVEVSPVTRSFWARAARGLP
jgi:Opioid growth factor receptor (OGFr) conserved region